MTGAALGLSPRQIDDMTLWEFNCCVTGFAKANGAEDKAPEYSDDILGELGIVGFD